MKTMTTRRTFHHMPSLPALAPVPVLVPVLVLLLQAGLARAQPAPEAPRPPELPQPPELLAWAEAPPLLPDADVLLQAAGELDRERVVKGAPYCADAVHETVQVLADGNRIVHQQKSRLCRDGEGRTRQEVERGGRKRVYLRDPVAGRSWLLDPERKSARLLGAPMAVPAAPAVPAVPPVPPAPPAPVRIVIDDGAGPVALPLPPAPPLQMPVNVVFRAQSLAPRGPGVASPLGTRDIEGVKANGERTTWTIEAGRLGNEKPIVITRDVWTSPELMLTVQSRDFDPRSGEVNYRLVNLKRGEPDPALMKPPADYQSAPPPAPASAGKG
jgi:hypothetical protein